MDLSALGAFTAGAALKEIFSHSHNFECSESSSGAYEETRTVKWFKIQALVLNIGLNERMTQRDKDSILNEVVLELVRLLRQRMEFKFPDALDFKNSLKADLDACYLIINQPYLEFNEKIRAQEEREEKDRVRRQELEEKERVRRQELEEKERVRRQELEEKEQVRRQELEERLRLEARQEAREDKKFYQICIFTIVTILSGIALLNYNR